MIQIRQGPKWFIWPTNKSQDEAEPPKKNGSNQENTELDMPRQETAQTASANMNTANVNAIQCTVTASTMTAGVAQQRRNSRFSNRRKFAFQPQMQEHSQPIAIEGKNLSWKIFNQYF